MRIYLQIEAVNATVSSTGAADFPRTLDTLNFATIVNKAVWDRYEQQGVDICRVIEDQKPWTWAKIRDIIGEEDPTLDGIQNVIDWKQAFVFADPADVDNEVSLNMLTYVIGAGIWDVSLTDETRWENRGPNVSQVVNGVVTFTQPIGTWDTTGQLQFNGDGTWYTVATRDSSLQATLEDLTVNFPPGTPTIGRVAKTWAQWAEGNVQEIGGQAYVNGNAATLPKWRVPGSQLVLIDDEPGVEVISFEDYLAVLP
jgi:hypothetical protein